MGSPENIASEGAHDQKRITLDDALEEGFNELLTNRDEIKILVTPHDDWIDG